MIEKMAFSVVDSKKQSRKGSAAKDPNPKKSLLQ